jgi:outer membrane receptor protein involved in Fe transport
VIQIFTKRGDAGLARPQVDAEASAGMLQTPYAGYGGVLRQKYVAAIRGGGSDVSYNFGAGYTRTGDYLPNGEVSRQSNPSIYGGMHFARGMVTADVAGRYYVQNNPYNLSPDLLQTGFAYFSKPFDRPYQYQNQTMGTQITLTPTSWWQNRVTVGVDRYSSDWAQTQPRLTTPSDTLLNVGDVAEAKASIGYNTSVHGTLSPGISGSITAGFDHYSLTVNDWLTGGAINTIGGIQTDADQPVSAERFTTNNSGYFAQVQVGVRERLFLTGGLRAEQNSNFGDSLGTPISPRAGLSYVQEVGGTTLKIRGSWGRAIHAPSPGFKSASDDPFGATLANPQLGPERQKGGDVGVDAVFGPRGSASVTYFDQTAEGLIQYVPIQFATAPTYQYQNVGQIKNTGIEVEGTLQVGQVQFRGQYAYTRARLNRLAPGYTGDFRIGDQAQNTPKHTAGAGLSFIPFARTMVSAGLTYVGSWTNYDDVGEFRCFGGTGPCQPSSRDYLISYPGFAKVNATITEQVTPLVSGFVSVDNLTNNQASEITNSSAAIGRITTVGLRFHY